MTRKHFEAIARSVRAIADEAERQKQAKVLALLCALRNPRFDSKRFLAACLVREVQS